MAPIVLIADGEPHVGRLIEIALQRIGCEVLAAAEAAQALALLQDRPVRVLILDATAPHSRPYELLRQVRADPSLGPLKTMVLTARAGDEACLRDWQADACLVAPFDPQELISLVTRLLDEDDGVGVRQPRWLTRRTRASGAQAPAPLQHLPEKQAEGRCSAWVSMWSRC